MGYQLVLLSTLGNQCKMNENELMEPLGHPERDMGIVN
jgi:hypothetical protein